MSERSRRELNELINRLNPREFEDFVYDVLVASMKNDTFERETRLGQVRIDIFAVSADPPGRAIAFGAKKAAIRESEDVVWAQINRRDLIQRQQPDYRFVLIIGGDLTDAASEPLHDKTVLQSGAWKNSIAALTRTSVKSGYCLALLVVRPVMQTTPGTQ